MGSLNCVKYHPADRRDVVSLNEEARKCCKLLCGSVIKSESVVLTWNNGEFIQLSDYLSKEHNDSEIVLLFPPVNNYRRFLIHKVCEEFSKELGTFSIGQGHGRRTVVCFKEQLIVR
uniref:(California timema) hypothetical protein n=1 Tax=Timema californicum TaxID=61474 RepID=A0A7R9J318_TIMCA|nr:unnamed protein product [Timema californicum]